MHAIQCRKKVTVNTDPQRRCYNGCNFSEEEVWTPWETIQHVTKEKIQQALEFWRDLNSYSVSVGGCPCEYQALEV